MGKSNRPVKPGISEAELAVLRLLWTHGASTVRELHDHAHRSGQSWGYTTVQTLLTRLADKGYVQVERNALAHVFRATVDREQLAAQRVEAVVSELLDGATEPLLLHLVEGKFTAADIERFRAMLANAKKRGKTSGGS